MHPGPPHAEAPAAGGRLEALTGKRREMEIVDGLRLGKRTRLALLQSMLSVES